jgi:hypothetical protein
VSARNSRQQERSDVSGRGAIRLDDLGLRLPKDPAAPPYAEVRGVGQFNPLLDESHTSLTLQSNCERAWYLGSGLAPGVPEEERRILRTLSSYLGGLGVAVHDGIRRVLEAQRERLNPEGRVLKSSTSHDFARILEDAAEMFAFMEGDSWSEAFPNGRADREHPRYREHLKLKYDLVGSSDPAHVAVPSDSPDHSTYKRQGENLVQALKNWYELFYLDTGEVFRHDPRQLIPPGGLQRIDPALILEVEEKNISYAKQDAFEILALGGLAIPYYELEVPVQTPPVREIAERGLPARFTFRIKTVLDFVYLTFTQRGEPRLVAMDWKTNRIDPHSGKPALVAQEEHAIQLKHYALYLMQRYRDVFQRFEPEIQRSFERTHRPRLELPRELTADMIYLGDAYIGGEGFSAPYRFRPTCAADLDLDSFVKMLRGRLGAKVDKFSSVYPPVSDALKWAPTGLESDSCGSCNQAPLCPDAPAIVREEWPASCSDMLSRLKHPGRIPLV